MIQQRVVAAYHQEVERAKLPGYVSSYADFDEEPPGASPGRPAAVRVDPPGRQGAPHELASRLATAPRPQAPQRGLHKPPDRPAASRAPRPPQPGDFGQGIF
jgi:hypothetical protein